MLKTTYSNNIRNDFGFLAKTNPNHMNDPNKLFSQQGRKVFKDIVGLVNHILYIDLKILLLKVVMMVLRGLFYTLW